MSSRKIIMLPLPIGSKSIEQMNTPHYVNTVKQTTYWVAENARTLRRFIASLELNVNISELEIFELGRRPDAALLHKFLEQNIQKGDIAVVSEAGLAGMADPGAEVARWAQEKGIVVAPQTGPGSVYLALCASGFNGQQFSFHGYCPVKEPELVSFIKRIAAEQKKTGYTQIFIETPYRNDRLLETMLPLLPPESKLCIASDIQGENERIRTKTAAEWLKALPKPGKVPAVFLLGDLR